MNIELQSVQSLYVEMYFNETCLSSGTAFLAQSPAGIVLVTNRHNVTGRRQDNNQTLSKMGGVPNKIKVWRNAAGNLGGWIPFTYDLYDADEQRRWVEHPTLGASADFVAMPIDTPFNITNYPYSTETPKNEMLIRAAETVSVIGFPFGLAAGGMFGIWVSGFIASEPVIDYNDQPTFLIDCRSRPGQSGSPVIATKHGMAAMQNGIFAMGEDFTEFLGIYSGRLNEQSDLGIVWKRRAVNELVQSIT